MESNNRRFSFRAIWSSDLLQNLCPIAFLTVSVWLCSCEANLFGPESREIVIRLMISTDHAPLGTAPMPHFLLMKTFFIFASLALGPSQLILFSSGGVASRK
jgi:hypothetical protein